MTSQTFDLIVIGGGAAGFFCAINFAEKNPGAKIIILEAANQCLSKVKVSGGGRCNLTHACYDHRLLVQYYPRGMKELLGPFHRFGVKETLEWFHSHGVLTKTEEDGRMFPESNRSETIIKCFLDAVESNKIALHLSERVLQFSKDSSFELWEIKTSKNQYTAINLFVASGSDHRIWDCLSAIGHRIIPPVPSLFTFNLLDKKICDLNGLSVPNGMVSIQETKFNSVGPILITHWGLSGPAILKLSSWASRDLFDRNYNFFININWTGKETKVIEHFLIEEKRIQAKKFIYSNALFDIPQRLWKYICDKSEIDERLNWATISKKQLQSLIKHLTEDSYEVIGKSTFKQEFVSAGGIDLKEVDFKKFESKIIPELFFAGEVLNIDALTGGFNFQAAWTGAYIAADAMQ